MKDYLIEARALHHHAVEEFQRGVRENDELVIRDAAKKAWNAIVRATNHLFAKLRGTVPRTHYHRRKGILELATTHPVLKKKALLDRYMARELTLHEYCFYEGNYERPILEENLKKVKAYIDDVEALTNGDNHFQKKS
jgi:hypothetical protein